MGKIKTGDTIPVKKEHWEHVKALQDEEKAALCLMKSGGHMYRQALEKLWNFVFELYPELKDFHMTLHSDDKDLVFLITGKK